MLNPAKKAQGVTLVELLVATVVLAILLAIGVPSYSSWLQNSQIRTATESIINGLQLARVEAVRRNEPVNFILGTGTSWTVQTVAGAVIQTRASTEGSKNVTLIVTPGGATKATFNELGMIANASTAPTQINVDVPTSILPASESRDLRIQITGGGQIRSCDPIYTDNSDPRYCKP